MSEAESGKAARRAADADETGEGGGPGADAKVVTAALVVIGNEVLSGRTKDANTPFLATRLGALGVRLMEVRVVRDEFDAIGAAVNALRKTYDYVFTSGGIGPTHDDITAEAIARAFGVDLLEHGEALARLERHYGDDLTPARRRMARVPDGGILIDNPVSTAPGFQVENVFVMAGVPSIMQAMFEGIRHQLAGGQPLLSRTVRTDLPEGQVAESLSKLQAKYADVEIGSYPQMRFARSGGFSVRVVLRSTDADRLTAAMTELIAAVAAIGGRAEEVESGPGRSGPVRK